MNIIIEEPVYDESIFGKTLITTIKYIFEEDEDEGGYELTVKSEKLVKLSFDEIFSEEEVIELIRKRDFKDIKNRIRERIINSLKV